LFFLFSLLLADAAESQREVISLSFPFLSLLPTQVPIRPTSTTFVGDNISGTIEEEEKSSE